MEHAEPLTRSFPWRLTALVASALTLALLAGLVLTHGSGQTHPAAATRRVPKAPALAPLRPRSQLSVLVLNGNGISGAAGTEATSVLARGYRHAVPADAAQLDYARSLVLYRPGYQREAERLAKDVKIPTVATFDGRLASEYARDQLVVILGAK